MKTIEPLLGTTIQEAAVLLKQSAPARMVFNGITLRARYATAQPSSIVAEYSRQSERRAYAWRHSPDGIRVAEERKRRAAESRLIVEECLAALGDLDFENPAAVLAWVERVAEPSDHVDVNFNRSAVQAFFTRNGWAPGANCKPGFDPDDARNVAGWIVGQFLAGYPNVQRFIDGWRQKFVSKPLRDGTQDALRSLALAHEEGPTREQ